MIEWPEKKFDDITLAEKHRCEGWNEAVATCKSAFEKQGLKPLDRKTWMDMMMPFHGGNPDTWAKSLDKIYEDYFDPKTHKSSQRFGATEGTK